MYIDNCQYTWSKISPEIHTAFIFTNKFSLKYSMQYLLVTDDIFSMSFSFNARVQARAYVSFPRIKEAIMSGIDL